MYSTSFIRITHTDKKISLHDEYPLVQSHDIVLLLETGSDDKPMNVRIVPNGKWGAEPVFTLRASDPMASAYVRHWAEMAQLLGINHEKVISAKVTADAMREWMRK